MSSNTENHGLLKFVNGGLAGIGATLIVHPVDVLKTRMQLAGTGTGVVYTSSLHAATSVVKSEGPLALYDGLSASILRQITYTAARLGIYQFLEDSYRERHGGVAPSFAAKMGIGMLAGGLGALVGTPADVSLIRMASDGRLPLDQRRNYKHCFDALARMVREEGVTTLWRGWKPTVARAVVLNSVQLASYSQAKQMILASNLLEDGLQLHFVSSLISGFFSAVASLPIDNTKTKLQSMKHNEYRGMVDCFVKTVQKESVFSLWKGFTPYFLRLGPHTIITFMIFEQLNRLMFKKK